MVCRISELRRSYVAIPELTLRRAKKELADFCDSRIPAHVRHEIRLEVDFTEGATTMYECHPPWNPEWTEWSRVGPIAFSSSATMTGE